MAFYAKTYVIIDVYNFKQLDHYFTSPFKLQFRVRNLEQETPFGFLRPAQRVYEFETTDFTAQIHRNTRLNEVFMFVMETNCFPVFESTLQVDVQLHIKGIQSKKFPADERGYSLIGTTRLQLKNPHDLANEYVEVVFDDLVCSAVSLSIHSSLVAYEFKPLRAPIPTTATHLTSLQRRLLETQSFSQFLAVATKEGELGLVDEVFADYNKRLKVTCERLLSISIKYANLVYENTAILSPHGVKELSSIRLHLKKADIPYSTAFNNYIYEMKKGRQKEVLMSKFNFVKKEEHTPLKKSRLPTPFVNNITSIDPSQFRRNKTAEQQASESVVIQPDIPTVKSQIYNDTKLSDVLMITSSGYFKQPDNVFRLMEDELKEIGHFALTIFLMLERIIKLCPEVVNKTLRVDFHNTMRDKYLDRLLVDSYEVDEFWELGKDIYKNSETIAQKMRRLSEFTTEFDFNRIENLSAVDKYKLSPIFFEENFFKLSSFKNMAPSLQQAKSERWKVAPSITNIELDFMRSTNLMEKSFHLIVLVHGYQGSDFDMRLYKNFIIKTIPSADFLLSRANKDHHDESIFVMGRNLADEVVDYIRKLDRDRSIRKISFIGHSLGGVIIRAALPLLREYKALMATYISLSSPHLGCAVTDSVIIGLGMKILKSIRKSQLLKQLDLSDHESKALCALYKLSEAEGLNWFRNIIFVSSKQDGYVNYESARIQISENLLKAGRSGQVCAAMIKNMLSRLSVPSITRLSIDMKSKEKSIGWWTGKTPHIEFLECHDVIHTILYRYADLLN